MSNKKSKVLLIVNPCAGRTKSRAGTFDIVNKFSTNDYDFSIHTTKCQGDATNIVKEHYEGKDLVVCCGGDGTLNETINGVMDMANRVPIGYIPTGTTNDLANTLGIPSDIGKATDLIMSGKTNTYDIGLFNNRYFSYVASFGAFSSASYNTSQKMKNIFGHSAYLWKGFMDWGSLKPIHVKIEHDEGVFEGDVMLGAVTNSTSMGGICKFDRNKIKLNDGYFELFIIKKIRLLTVADLFFKVQKQDYSHEAFVFIKTRQAKFTFEDGVEWSLDGEFGGEHKVVNIHVLSKAINICSGESDLFEKEPEKSAVETDEAEEKVSRFKKFRKQDKASEAPEAVETTGNQEETSTETDEQEPSEPESKFKKIKLPKRSEKEEASVSE